MYAFHQLPVELLHVLWTKKTGYTFPKGTHVHLLYHHNIEQTIFETRTGNRKFPLTSSSPACSRCFSASGSLPNLPECELCIKVTRCGIFPSRSSSYGSCTPVVSSALPLHHIRHRQQRAADSISSTILTNASPLSEHASVFMPFPSLVSASIDVPDFT